MPRNRGSKPLVEIKILKRFNINYGNVLNMNIFHYTGFTRSLAPFQYTRLPNIQGDIGALLGKNCRVEKMRRFLKETEMYEEI